MRILITGSAGQIGKYVSKMLEDHDLLLVDRKTENDLNDDETKEVIEKFKPEAVFHLAASFERLSESAEFYKVNWEDNILATQNLIECMGKPKQVIFASSYLIYQMPYQKQVMYENYPIEPRNLCGASKLWAEYALGAVCQNLVNARIFRVYSKESNCFINHFAGVKKLGGKTNVWNTSGTFDFIHASDVASALVALFDARVSGNYNVGTGVGHSVEDVINLTGVEVVRAVDLPYTEMAYASIGKIKGATGWSPKMALADGVGGVMK